MFLRLSQPALLVQSWATRGLVLVPGSVTLDESLSISGHCSYLNDLWPFLVPSFYYSAKAFPAVATHP